MSIFKNFTITERVKAQFQAEFFNVFNHPIYANPNGCVDCSSGGLITGLETHSLMRPLQLGVRGSVLPQPFITNHYWGGDGSPSFSATKYNLSPTFHTNSLDDL